MASAQPAFIRENVGARGSVAIARQRPVHPGPSQSAQQGSVQQSGQTVVQQRQLPLLTGQPGLQQGVPAALPPVPIIPDFAALHNAHIGIEGYARSLLQLIADLRQQVHHVTGESNGREVKIKEWENHCQDLWMKCEDARLKAEEQHDKEIRELNRQHEDDFLDHTRESTEQRVALCLTIRKVQKDGDDLRAALAQEKEANKITLEILRLQRQDLQDALVNEQATSSSLQDRVEEQQAALVSNQKTVKAVAARSVVRTAIHRWQTRKLQAKVQTAELLSNGLCMEVTRLEGELGVAVDVVRDWIRKNSNFKSARKEIGTENDKLHAELDCVNQQLRALEEKLKTAEGNYAKEKASLKDSEGKRKVEQDEIKKVRGGFRELKAKFDKLETLASEQKTTLKNNTGELVKKGNEIKALVEGCSRLRKIAEEDNENSVALNEAKKDLEKENADLQEKLQQTQQQLQESNVAKAAVEKEYAEFKQVAAESRKAGENSRKASRKLDEMLGHDTQDSDEDDAPPRKKNRSSNSTTPPVKQGSPDSVTYRSALRYRQSPRTILASSEIRDCSHLDNLWRWRASLPCHRDL
ncbi:hypothetical protein CLAFUW4_13006 [Fulvia fulva]|uniref:uncharacterized protein n=1 Tax=Passalora fulva TaxID=5499 RepID=UPI0028526C3B|nr:uncharacterized protein CLAFUR5_20343 [Fulvia fulva]KAK4612263.1 hypothetical protein CLAFUR4_13010 [Fulvia fulva]WMI39047.1 hypothetical protein CLAFUR5_20343 [Fulvia fulva]WPV21132.1 hypothetical protein CLAFUW4_13006 [Fulvia fulva]WPV35943.1 hypothetical protein CLAFUW7_13013 [Fulvia fulva]